MSNRLEDLFCRLDFEHLIQTEPNYGYCETCQKMSNEKCHTANSKLRIAIKELRSYLKSECNKARVDELRDMLEREDETWIESSLPNNRIHIQFVYANTLKDRISSLEGK